MRRKFLWKKNLFTRSLSLFLSAALSLSAVPVTAMAADVPDTETVSPSESAEVPADELQLQTITASPDENTEAAVTLDGMMPVGAEVSVQDCDPRTDGSLCAYDITITDGSGEEFQPESDAPIQVEIRNPAVLEAAAQEKHLRIWHIDDNGIREEITEYQLTGDAIVFETNGFSVFEVDNGEPPLRTYVFEMPEDPSDNSGYKHYYFPTNSADSAGNHKMICQQIVKNDEKPIFPQLPADISSRYTFTGWFVWNEGTLADTPFDFEHVESVTQNETVTLRAVFKSCVYAIFHDQYRSQSQKFPVYATRRGDLEHVSGTDIYGNLSDSCAEVTISDLSVTYDDETGPGSSLTTMAFKGWTVVPDNCQTQEQIKAYTESPNVPVIKTDTILISGTTRLYPVFEAICWLDFNTNQDGPGADANHYSGATYKPPLYFPASEGFDFSEESVPMLAGYTFDGWYTGENKQVTDGNLTLNANLNTSDMIVQNGKLFFKEKDPRTAQVELYAHWIPVDSKYTIVLWMQQASDTPDLGIDAEGKDHRHWDFFKSYSQTAQTGTSVSVAEMYRPEKLENLDQALIPDTHTRDKLKGFTLDHWDDAKTVKGNGGTILNVYYRRNAHTFTFRNSNNNQTLHTVTALYGSDISNIWRFTGSDGNNYPMTTGDQTTSWMPVVNGQDGVRITQMLLMPDKDITFRHYTTGNTQRTFHYYVEALPGTPDTLETRTYNDKKYIPYNENLGTLKHDFRIVNYNADFFELEGFTRLAIATPQGTNVTSRIKNAGDDGVGWQSLGTNELWFYYTRNSYNAEFKDPENPDWSRIETILYDQATVGYVPQPPEPPEGHYFTGWYAEKECVTPVAFTEDEANALRAKGKNFQDYTKMPAHAILVYAGWETQWFKIEIDPDGGTLTGSQATWFWEPYYGDPIEEYKTVTRNFEPDVNGEYYYTLRNRAYYGLGEEWDPAEDTTYRNQIIDGHCTRGAFYSTDPTLKTDTMRYKEAEGAYRYLGWFEVDPVTGKETPFNFGTRIMKNTFLKLHWKQLDTYYISYHAGEGTIDSLDSNEQTFEFLDADNYADHADVVVTRVAIAPPGKNFVGWQIQNDESGTIYYPGQSFQFDSRFADLISEIDEEGHVRTKRLITLNAVYQEIRNAQIIYDPNGGTIDSRALSHAGGQDSSRAPQVYTAGTDTPLTAAYAISGNCLIVSDLMNNAAVTLADGIGFTNNGYTFCGWSTTPDGQNGSFFRANSIRCYADTAEPLVLYAQWELRLCFDKNNSNAPDNNTGWGGDWSASGYAWSAADQQYCMTIRLGSIIRQPVYVPVSDRSNEMFRYWSLGRQTAAGIPEDPFDFSVRITQTFADQYTTVYTDSFGNIGRKLTLYGCWYEPISIPVHIVDTTDAAWAKRDDWLRDGVTGILLGNETISLADTADAEVYADPDKTVDKHFAFACTAGNGADDYLDVSDDRTILALRYDPADRQVKAKYSTDDAWHVFDISETAPEAVYLVYYADRTIPISYMKFKISRTLETVNPLDSNAPQQASVFETGYHMAGHVRTPLAWAISDDYQPTSYSFAVGDLNAGNAAALHTVTEASETDSHRPVLNIRNIWNGWIYTLDGETWQMSGYDKQLYVLYYQVKPCVVTLTEKTIGLPEDMDETFDYTMSFSEYTSTTVTRTYYYRTGRNNNYTYHAITNNSNYQPVVTTTDTNEPILDTDHTPLTQNLQLSDGQRESIVLLYTAPDTQTGIYIDTGDNYWGYPVYYREVTDTQYAQKMEVTQSRKEGYLTSNDAPGGDQEYVGSCTGGDDPVTITYTNRHVLEKHIHLAIARNGILTHDPSLRTTNANIYAHIFDDTGDTWNLTQINAESFIIDLDGKYVYAETIAGYENENGVIIPTDRSLTADSLTFGELSEGVYGYYLNGDTAQPLENLEIFLVYYERPTICYMFRSPQDGTLLPINPLTRNGSAFLRNGSPAAQNEMLPVTAEQELLLAQISTPGHPAFLLPDLLDYGTQESMLDLTEIGIPHPDGTIETSRSGILRLGFAEDALQYAFTASDPPKAFDGEQVVYAIYRIRGYALTIAKSVVGDAAGGPEQYTFRIDSELLADGAYYIGGSTDTDTVTASGHSITLNLKKGEEVTIYGLMQGDYIVTEETTGGFTMAASLNDHSAIVNGNKVAVYLHTDTVLRITNIYPIPVTAAQDTTEPYRMIVSVLTALTALSVLLYSRRKKTHETASL